MAPQPMATPARWTPTVLAVLLGWLILLFEPGCTWWLLGGRL